MHHLMLPWFLRPSQWMEYQTLIFLDPKTHFSNYFRPKILRKLIRNHENLYQQPKKTNSPQKPKLALNQKPNQPHIYVFKDFQSKNNT